MSALGADGAQTDGAQIDGGQNGSEPEGPPAWLGPIQDRMEELHEQSSRIAEQLGGYEDDDDGYALTDDEYAAYEAELGADIDTLADEDDDEPDMLDMVYEGVDRAVSRREAAADAERAIEDRNAAFEALREAMPILQDPQLATQIVQAAQAKAMRWDPSLINQPEFIHLVETELLAHIGKQARGQQAEANSRPEVVLESAAGSTVQQSDEIDWGDRMLAAAQKLHPKI